MGTAGPTQSSRGPTRRSASWSNGAIREASGTAPGCAVGCALGARRRDGRHGRPGRSDSAFGEGAPARATRALRDRRGFGSSGRASHWRRTDRVDFDVLGAIRTLRSRGAQSIVLGGASLGGAAVLAAAAQATPAVDGVISFSSPQIYVNVNAFAAVRALRVPALFLAQEDDDPFDDDARAMYEACASTEKRLEVTAGPEHGFRLLQTAATRGLVDAFIAGHSTP